VPLEIQHLLKAFPVRNMTSGSVQRTGAVQALAEHSCPGSQTQRLAIAELGLLNAQLPAIP